MGRSSNTPPGIGIGEIWQSERTVEICRAASEEELEAGTDYNTEVSSEHSIRAARGSASLGEMELLRWLEVSKASLEVPWREPWQLGSHRALLWASEGVRGLVQCWYLLRGAAPKNIFFLSCFIWLFCHFSSVFFLSPAVVALLPSHFQDCTLGRRAVRYIQTAQNKA